MSWGGNNNNNRNRPWIEVNFGRPQPPQQVVEIDIGRRGGYGSRSVVEVDVFGGVPRAPPPPPRPVVEVDIINRPPQYPGYPAYPQAYPPAQPAVVVSTQQQPPPYPNYGGGYNNGYGAYGGNNYPPEHFNNPRW